MSRVLLLVVAAAAFGALTASVLMVPEAAHAVDVHFSIVTEAGNIFPLTPPDLPRPANIIGETAHLVVRNPPAAMFVVTAPNGTTHKFTPMQSGLDVTGFGSGTIRVITGDAWDMGTDHKFRDQPFGTMRGSPDMYHRTAMPLSAAVSASYHNLTLVDDSRFGLDPPTGHGNSLGLAAGSNGEYTIQMSGRNRAGLDFGPGAGTDQTYYIYRGCSSCATEVVVGHGSPSHDQSALPNDPVIVDHERGWKSTGSCTTSTSNSWSGTGSRTLTSNYNVPAAAHSRAGDHHIANRYDDLSVLPGSHSSCSPGTLYTENTADNRKHDMCVSGTSASASTRYSYPYTRTVTTDTIVNGTVTGTTTSTTGGSTTRTTTGSCNTPTTAATSDGYRVSARCSGGPSPSNPPQDRTTYSSTGNLNSGTITTTVVDYSSPSVTTTGRTSASCGLTTNTPHLNLADAMTVQPGLSVYRPPAIPTNHNVIIILDDTENGGGGTEYIQVLRHAGASDDPAGPFEFHLRPTTAGILYDAHRHYGWVDARTYNAAHLADMGYTARSVLVGLNDGLRADGGDPYLYGTRLCHGDCFMGAEGIDGTKPMLRVVDPPPRYSLPSSPVGLTYDHLNDRWFSNVFAGMDGLVTASSLYLVVPFAVDTNLTYVRMYDEHFDPAAQEPSAVEVPGTPLPCHITQGGQVANFANSLAVTAGESISVPVIPEMRYLAFMGDGICHWYDISALPSPLSSVASGARAVPLVNGTVLGGDLTARSDGTVHVDVVVDLEAVWQSEMYGFVEPAGPPSTVSWVVPPLEVEMVAVARVNGAVGACGTHNVYCSSPIALMGTSTEHGSFIHGAAFTYGEPYAEAPLPLPAGGSTGTGVYGLPDGRCYGLESVVAATGGIAVRDIPHIGVSAGDTVTLGFEAVARHPDVAGGHVDVALPAGDVCRITETVESATLKIRTMTATLR